MQLFIFHFCSPTLDSLVNISMGPMYSRLSRLSINRWADWWQGRLNKRSFS